MKVYAIYVEATNDETCDSWNYIYKLFSTEEKAIDFINNEENLRVIVQTDWPVQLFFKRESTSKEKIFEAAAYDEVSTLYIINYKVSIEEMEVE